MANVSGIDCKTCGGDRVLTGDKPDHVGERTDDVVPCPDCTSDEFDDRETSPFDRADYSCEADAFIERRLDFDFGGEA